jgi:rhodanese-related sulfurtransferase
LLLTDAVEVWLIGWAAGQSTSVHDHGGAAGALTVVEGALEEEEFDPELRLPRRGRHRAGTSAGFAPAHVHRIFNHSPTNATSLHAYSPPGQHMHGFVVAGLEEPEVDGYDRDIVVVCSERYTSSLAAASLQALGLHRATDLSGGFRAWAAAGLPTTGQQT